MFIVKCIKKSLLFSIYYIYLYTKYYKYEHIYFQENLRKIPDKENEGSLSTSPERATCLQSY